MERTPVESSQLASIGYDAEKSILEIEFNGPATEMPAGKIIKRPTYRYFDVPAETHKALMEAESIGKYFGQHIRGKFKHEKHEPEAAEGASA